MSDIVEVTQADRDASWPVRPECYKTEADRQWWMTGKYDHLRTIQAFAAHRIQSTAAAADAIERLEAVLNKLQIAEANYRHNHDAHGDGSLKAGRSWDLMRRAGNEARKFLPLDEIEAALKGQP